MAENIETPDENVEETTAANPEDQRAQAEKRSVLFIVYPILLVLVAGIAVLGTSFFLGRESTTEQNVAQIQYKGDTLGYRINPDSRAIFIPPVVNDPISVQPKNDNRMLAMVRLQLIVESKVHQRWNGLQPEVLDILRGEIRDQITLVLAQKTTDQLQNYDKGKREQYARDIRDALNMYVFNQFTAAGSNKKIKKGQQKKNITTHFTADPIKKVVFYEMLVVSN